MNHFDRFRFLAAAWFNLGFALLATVTLLGIIFITQPKAPMHNVPPGWWIPIACLMIPGLWASQLFTWRTVRKKTTPSPLEISAQHRIPSTTFRPLLASFWFSNYVIQFVILVSLYKPDPNRQFEIAGFLVVLLVTFFLTTIANTYLMLFTRNFTTSEWIIHKIWKVRHCFTVLIALVGIVYYCLMAN